MRHFKVYLVFLFSLTAHAIENSVLYRVVQTPAVEFIRALKSDLPPEGSQTKNNLGNSNRLDKFFRIKSKLIELPKISIRVEPKARFFPELLQKISSVDVEIIELIPQGPESRFHVTFILSKTMTVNGLMTVTAQDRFCRLKFEVQESTMPMWIMARLIDLALKLNLATAAQENMH